MHKSLLLLYIVNQIIEGRNFDYNWPASTSKIRQFSILTIIDKAHGTSLNLSNWKEFPECIMCIFCEFSAIGLFRHSMWVKGEERIWVCSWAINVNHCAKRGLLASSAASLDVQRQHFLEIQRNMQLSLFKPLRCGHMLDL